MRINTETTINPSEILFLESNANYTFVYTAHKKYISSRTLKVLATRIDENDFMKIKRGLIINKNFVKSLHKDVVEPYLILANGRKLPISRRLFAGVCERLN
jgi:DNA-binding LytR/AlgR family response regulator